MSQLRLWKGTAEMSLVQDTHRTCQHLGQARTWQLTQCLRRMPGPITYTRTSTRNSRRVSNRCYNTDEARGEMSLVGCSISYFAVTKHYSNLPNEEGYSKYIFVLLSSYNKYQDPVASLSLPTQNHNLCFIQNYVSSAAEKSI